MFYFLVYLPAQILVIDIPVISIMLALSEEKSSMPNKDDATGLRGHAVWVIYIPWYICNCYNIPQAGQHLIFALTKIMQISDISCFENNVDPDQLASRKPADQDPHCFQHCLYMHTYNWNQEAG